MSIAFEPRVVAGIAGPLGDIEPVASGDGHAIFDAFDLFSQRASAVAQRQCVATQRPQKIDSTLGVGAQGECCIDQWKAAAFSSFSHVGAACANAFIANQQRFVADSFYANLFEASR